VSRASLVLASELSGRPVVSIDSGNDIAEIRDTVYDSYGNHLIGFTLNKRGWFRGRCKQTLPIESIAAIGRDAVIVEREQDLIDPVDAPATLTASKDSIPIIGIEVMTQAGEQLGTIDDLVVETGDEPRAVGFRLSSSGGPVFVPISAQMALSGERLLLPAEADAFVRHDLAGFGASVSDYRSSLDDATEGEDPTWAPPSR